MRSLLKDVALGIAAFVAVQFYGCAAAKPVIRTAWDIARDLCHVVAAQNADRLNGLSVEQYCAIADNLMPAPVADDLEVDP
jgi:hypothetical protein